ncbi:MAG: hypothetical protein OEV30_01485, partial [Ignavibacteria bacterium]|nr:hypothetical protein [Ignavibacteria bacterium]
MSRAFLISSGIPLVVEVIRHLGSERTDYSDALVVFPGKRPAHFLRKGLAGNGRSCIPPMITSMDRFVELLNTSRPAHSTRRIDSIDAAAILFDLHGAVPDRIGGDQFNSLDSFLPLGLRLFEELEELVLSCRAEKEIGQAVEGVSLRGLHSLGILYERFYEKIRTLGRTTRALDYRTAALEFPNDLLSGFSTVILAGLFPISEAERRLILSCMENRQTVALFQEGPGILDELDRLGIEVMEKGSDRAQPVISYHAAPDSHGEIFGLAGLLADSIAKEDEIDHSTVIVVPDPSILPALVHHSLSMLDGGFNISVGYPHARTPLVGFLTSLMDLVTSSYENNLPASEYLRCFLHPYSKNILFDGKPHITRQLFHTIEDLCLQDKLPPFFSPEYLESQERLFTTVSGATGDEKATPARLHDHLHMIHESLLLPLTTVSSVGQCASRCIDILTFIADASTARKELFFDLSLESVIASLAEVRDSLLAERAIGDRASVFRIIRDCLLSGRVPLPGTPLRGVQVLGLLETRNLQFDRVFVLNTNDDLIPGESGRYSLVPNLVRRTLGLPTYRERDRIAEYYFSVLVRGARKVSLFFTEDGAKTPSRFV